MYHLNIVGNGRVTLALLKMIFDHELDRYIKKITIWCRQQKVLLSGRLINRVDKINEEILRIHLMQNTPEHKLNKREEKFEFREFASLKDLMNLNTDNDKNVLILAVKYDLDELIWVDKTKKEKINPCYENHFELLVSRTKFITSGIDTTDIPKDYPFRKKFLHHLSQILTEKKLAYKVIHELSQKTSVGYTRLYNLEHSAVSVKYLAQVLTNYNGFVLNIINEVDTINSLLKHFSQLKPEKIISPCENDTIRAKYFLRNLLQSKGIKAKEIILSYIGPHNHAGFIPPETVRVDGIPLLRILDPQEALSEIEAVTHKVNGFGEDIFLQKGSSDEDTVLGIYCTLRALFTNSRKVIRVSCYDKEHDLYSGFPGCFNNEEFIPLKNFLTELSQESKERLRKAISQQKLINQQMMSVIGNGP